MEKTAEQVDEMCDVWAQGYETGLREGISVQWEIIGWITNDSLYRLKSGGNHEGVVPIHRKKSNAAKTPVMKANKETGKLYEVVPTNRWVCANENGQWVVGEGDNEIAVCKFREDAFLLKNKQVKFGTKNNIRNS